MIKPVECSQCYNKMTCTLEGLNREQCFIRYLIWVYNEKVKGKDPFEITPSESYNTIRLPCKIGDEVWCIKDFKGHKQVEQGIVSEMFFDSNMRLIIVCKYVGRGEFGITIFNSKEEALQILNNGE